MGALNRILPQIPSGALQYLALQVHFGSMRAHFETQD